MVTELSLSQPSFNYSKQIGYRQQLQLVSYYRNQVSCQHGYIKATTVLSDYVSRGRAQPTHSHTHTPYSHADVQVLWKPNSIIFYFWCWVTASADVTTSFRVVVCAISAVNDTNGHAPVLSSFSCCNSLPPTLNACTCSHQNLQTPTKSLSFAAASHIS